MSNMSNYKEMLEALINKEIEVIGEPALKQARDLGIRVSDEGEVEGYEGSGDQVISELIDKYKQTTGPVAERIANDALSEYEESDSLAV